MKSALFAHTSALSITAHGDDLEMHHLGALTSVQKPYALVATDGEASTLNYSSKCLC